MSITYDDGMSAYFESQVAQGFNRPSCHFTLMYWECSDSEDGYNSEEWFTCKYCGCVKDENGKVIME